MFSFWADKQEIQLSGTTLEILGDVNFKKNILRKIHLLAAFFQFLLDEALLIEADIITYLEKYTFRLMNWQIIVVGCGTSTFASR